MEISSLTAELLLQALYDADYKDKGGHSSAMKSTLSVSCHYALHQYQTFICSPLSE